MSSKYTPLEYLTITRPDKELALIPAQWDETGIRLMGHTGHLRYQAGVVNGLDNSGFSSASAGQGLTVTIAGKDANLDTQVKAELDAAITALGQMTPTFGEAIFTNQSAVTAAQTAVQQLKATLQSDVLPLVTGS